MKKKICALLICLLLSGCQKSNESRFYLGSDENDLFSSFEEVMNYPMPYCNVSYPIEQNVIEQIEQLDIVNRIVPYYPLIVFPVDCKIDVKYQTDKEEKFQIVQCLNNESSIVLSTVSDREEFIKRNDIIYDFESESGVFINGYILSLLGYDIGNAENDVSKISDIGHSLILEFEVSIPVSGHIIPKELEYQRFLGDRDCPSEIFDIYEVDQYEKRTIELEIDGVVGNKSNEILGNEIGIPYALAQEIYNQVDPSEITISENSEPWRPTTYIIECDSDVDIDNLGDELEKIYPDYFLMTIEIDLVPSKYRKAK